ncbi:MAG: major capsid protein [Magnetococcales bacterium]|nr:major capsid protein [Magnetococcales bacterium]
MPLSANPFSGSAFNSVALTTAINLLPNMFGRVEQMNLMPAKPVRLRSIAVERRNGVLNLLPTVPPGGPATLNTRGKRDIRQFAIPQIPLEDIVRPEETQGIRAFGSENELQAYADVLAMHLQSMRNKHAITLEHLRMGALKGIILDADGSVIYNLFTEFGITQKVIDFQLSSAALDVKSVCYSLKRHVEDNLLGEFSDGIHCFVSAQFFDAFTSHAKVVKAWELYNQGAVLRDDMRKGFPFAGITFEEYRGQGSDASGTVHKFIADGEGIAFPTGTTQTFATHFAPADFIETVNTLGLPLYAKQEPVHFDRGTYLHTQSNPLPICNRPELLVKVTMS